MCSGCAGGLQDYSEENSSTGASPRKQTQNQTEVPTLQLHAPAQKSSPLLTGSTICPPRSQENTGEHTQSDTTGPAQPLSGTTESEELMDLQSHGQSTTTKENLPPPPLRPPKAPGWQRLRLSKLSPGGDPVGVSLLSESVTPEHPGGWSSFTSAPVFP